MTYISDHIFGYICNGLHIYLVTSILDFSLDFRFTGIVLGVKGIQYDNQVLCTICRVAFLIGHMGLIDCFERLKNMYCNRKHYRARDRGTLNLLIETAISDK